MAVPVRVGGTPLVPTRWDAAMRAEDALWRACVGGPPRFGFERAGTVFDAGAPIAPRSHHAGGDEPAAGMEEPRRSRLRDAEAV